MAAKGDRKPNWSVWVNTPDVVVYEAVALSLNINPKEIRTRQHAWMGGSTAFPHDESEEFDDRLLVLRRNLGESGLRISTPLIMGRPDYCGVRLAEFAAWANKLGWDIPSELGELAAKAKAAPPVALPKMAIPVRSAVVQSELASPEKVTLAWVWAHVPVSWMWGAVAALAAVFVAGLTLGQSETWLRLTGGGSALSPSVARPDKAAPALAGTAASPAKDAKAPAQPPR